MGPNFKKRVLTAAIGTPVIVLLLLAPAPVMTGTVVICSIIGLYEFYAVSGLTERKILCLFGFAAALVIPIVGGRLETADALLLVYLYILLLFVVMLCSHRTVSIRDLGLLLISLIYIPYFLSHIIFIRTLPYGNFYVWLVFIGAFMTDTCAYFSGKCFGRHKLCPQISPKKTIEGAVGGVLGCGLSFMLFGLIVNLCFSRYLDGGSMHYGLLFLLGLIAAVLSETGDLVASIIKRQFAVKDFGNLLPGHGGILDRCDSIILVAPVIFLFLYKIGLVL